MLDLNKRPRMMRGDESRQNSGDAGGKSPSKSYTAEFTNIFGADEAEQTQDGGAFANGRTDMNAATAMEGSGRLETDMMLGSEIFPQRGALANRDAEQQHSSDFTPNILLEQLAYIDNFMPSLEEDFTDINALALMDGENGGELGNQVLGTGGTNDFWGFDERLARELSVFADDSFVFHDEEKDQGDDGNNDNRQDDADESGNGDSGKLKRDAHFLTRRKNDFLKSQYDYSKSRFSSKKNKDPLNENTNLFPNSGASNNHNPSANFENNIGDSNNDVNVNVSEIFKDDVSDILNSIAQSKQPNTENNNDDAKTQIEPPDYSNIPTSSLVSLFPRVKVPSGAYNELISKGLKPEQVDAISVIIAHYELNRAKFSSPNNSDTQIPRTTALKKEGAEAVPTDSTQQQEWKDPLKLTEQVATQSKDTKNAQSDNFLNMLLHLGDVKNSDQLVQQTLSQLGKELSIETNEAIKNNSTSGKGVKKPKSLSKIQKSHQKRKEKELELESSVHELSELALTLQQKINTLEMENKLLKNLVLNSGKLDVIENPNSISRTILSNNKLSKKDSGTD